MDARRLRDADHFEGYLVTLEQTHEDFAALAAARRSIRCIGMRPLGDRSRSSFAKTLERSHRKLGRAYRRLAE